MARKASIAALAAARQGKYVELTKKFLQNFRTLKDETIKQYAQELGLDMQQFEKDLKDPSLNKMINQDMKTGRQAKVRGVPAVFINGKRIKKRSLENLTRVVNEEYNKKRKKYNKGGGL